jgi:hypothetical protein
MDLTASWPYIEEIAAKRLSHNKTPRHVSSYGPEIETIGAAGELAARRFLGLPEILHTTFDGGTDIVFAGTRIDVKATKLDPAHKYMQWPYWKWVKAPIILMTMIDIVAKKALVVGYATREDIMTSDINRRRSTWCYEIPIRNLRKASDLYALLYAKVQKNCSQRFQRPNSSQG